MEIPKPQMSDSTRFLAQSLWSLRNTPEGTPLHRFRLVSVKNGEGIHPLPHNDEQSLYYEIATVIRERQIPHPYPTDLYWDRGSSYNTPEIVGMLMECVDQHEAPLPKTAIPPQQDVLTYVQTIYATSGAVTIPQQWNYLLDITNNHVLGATHLGFVANRLMGRGADQRAFPAIHISEEDLFYWNNKMAQFSVVDSSGKSDGTGDAYYFFTHMFAALYFNSDTLKGKVGQNVFHHGTRMMNTIRRHIAKKPNITDHYESSLLGRNIGLALAQEPLA